MKNKAKLKIGLLSLAVLGLLLATIPANATANSVTVAKPTGTTSEVRDLGWTTYANAYRNISIERTFNETNSIGGGFATMEHYFSLFNEFNMTLTAGTYLPVNLTVVYPDTVAPGDTATIKIGVKRENGYAFLNLTGHHVLELLNEFHRIVNTTNFQNEAILKLYLSLVSNFSAGYMVNFRTPIGTFTKVYDNVARKIGTFDLKLLLNYTNPIVGENASANVNITASLETYLVFDAILIANTSVVGEVTVSGTALENEVNTTLVWTSEGIKEIPVKVSPNATENDTITANVQLKYVVHKFKVIFKNVSMMVKVNEVNIDSEIGSRINDTQLREWVRMRLRNVFEGFINGTHRVFIRVKNTVMHHRPSPEAVTLETESSTLESSSPYTVLTALSINTVIGIGEEGGAGGFLEGLPVRAIIVASVLAAVLVGAYIVIVRKRNHA